MRLQTSDWLLLTLAGLLTGCHGVAAPVRGTAPRVHLSQGPATRPEPPGASQVSVATAAAAGETPEIARAACPPALDHLEAAAKAFESRQFDVALACAEDELLDDPESAAAEQQRGAALAALGQTEPARLAYVHALALDPDDPEILADAADLYLTRGNVTREFDEIALQYAQRGEKRARRRRPELLGQLDLLAGMALNDLGRSQEAARKLDEALEHDPNDLDARYEHAVAAFELCRFADAKADLKLVLAALPDDAYAHHELGLTLEQLGEARGSKAELERATALDGEAFPPTLPVGMAEFKGMVDAAVKVLPPPLREDLKQVKLSVEELPDVTDLTVDDPPLSPTILGLFRGEPLPQPGSNPGGLASGPAAQSAPGAPGGTGGPGDLRAILLYHRNLLRVAHTREELAKQVQVTLWHELGHLRGADDDELRLRGLE